MPFSRTAPLNKPRCAWTGSDALYQTYHDREWGVPLHDDRHLFEFLILEGAQAGLSWITICASAKIIAPPSMILTRSALPVMTRIK